MFLHSVSVVVAHCSSGTDLVVVEHCSSETVVHSSVVSVLVEVTTLVMQAVSVTSLQAELVSVSYTVRHLGA